MIHQLRSSMPTFKTLTFRRGLNLLIAERRPGAKETETRNGVGKSSLIELVHFLLGSSAKPGSLFRRPTLETARFEMDFDLGGQRVTISRSGAKASDVRLVGFRPPAALRSLVPTPDLLGEIAEMKNDVWCDVLGRVMFGLRPPEPEESNAPTFRTMFGFFARRDRDGGFADPFTHVAKMPLATARVALSALHQIDWTIAQGMQSLEDQAKDLRALRRIAKGETLQGVVGSADVLKARVFELDDKITRIERDLSRFEVLPQYRELEREADVLTEKLARSADDDVIDREAIEDMQRSVAGESVPDLGDLHRLYDEATVVLPELVRQRYEDVKAFHASVLRNRKTYLEREMADANARIAARAVVRGESERRRADIMRTLQGHRALEQYTAMQQELASQRAERDSLQRRLEATQNLGRRQSEIKLEQLRLQERLRRELGEREEALREITLTFRDVSSALYDEYGTLSIGQGPKGDLRFHIEKHAKESHAVGHMQVFCFDMTLAVLLAKRGAGPGFLLHDSHLFDGADERQKARALSVGASLSAKHGFQYIVTMNSDDMPKSFQDGFDPAVHRLPVVLTDAAEDGGLFGVRFD